MKRILHFVWRMSRGGGLPRFQRDLLRYANKERYEQHVCSVRPLFPEDFIEEIGDHVVLHPLDFVGKMGSRGWGRITSGVARILRQVRPDVLHTYTGFAWMAIPPDFLNRGPRGRILDIHTDPQGRQLSWLNTMSQRWMVRQLGYLPVVHSMATRDHVAEAFGVRPDAVTLIPTGIETVSFARPRTARQEWRRLHDIPQDALVVLNMARIAPVKNLPLYLEVARRVVREIDGAIFLVAGDGAPLRQTLETSVRNDGLQERIRFLGNREDLADVLHASDLFLCTSDHESFPIAVLEAMAAARPVVATAVGGIVEQVVDGITGRLCPVRDAQGLTQATLELLRDPERRMRLGEAGQDRARRLFDIRAMSREYEELYARMIEA